MTARSTDIRVETPFVRDWPRQTSQHPFHKWVYIGLLGIAGAVLIHERHVSLGGKPFLASDVPASSVLLQLLFLWLATVVVLLITVLDPPSGNQSSDKMQVAMYFTTLLCSIIGAFLGRQLVAGVAWDQQQVRRCMIYCPSLAMLMVFIRSYSMLQGHTSIAITSLAPAAAALATIPIVPTFCMWSLATPDAQKTFYMVLAQCARSCGLVLGPAIFGVVSSWSAGELMLSPQMGMITAFSSVAMLFVALATSLLTCAIVPTHMPAAAEEVALSELTEEQVTARQSIVWLMLCFCLERSLFVSLLESNSMTHLVSMGWGLADIGMLRVLSFALASLTCLLALVARRCGMRESSLIMVTAAVGIMGCYLHLFANSKANLFGAVSITCSSTVAMGIADGWASRAAVKGKWFSVENYRLGTLLSWQITSINGANLARLLDTLPSFVHACIKLAWLLLSAIALGKACRSIWCFTSATSPGEALHECSYEVEEESPKKVSS